MKNKYKVSRDVFEDNEIELLERLKMCLMLYELYEKNKKIDFLCSRKGCDSYISSFQLKQIYIAYMHVVVDMLKKNFSNKDPYRTYVSNINEILCKGSSKVIKDFRDKTFHFQNKSFSNTKELYNLYLDNTEEDTEKIIKIFKNLFNLFLADYNKMINTMFAFYGTKFYKNIKRKREEL